MKTTKILGATTLAGALLFTGVGATHSYEAHASDVQKVTLETPQDWQKKHDNLVKGRLEHPNQGGEGGGPGAVSSSQKSYREYVEQNLSYGRQVDSTEIIVPDEGKAYLNGQKNQNTNNTTANQNNEQQEQSNTNNTTAQNNNQGQSSQANNNTKSENNTQSQNQSQALPETGEESSNTTLVTMIASIILAAGSLLAFRRTSKSNK